VSATPSVPGPPDLGPPEGAVSVATSGRPPRGADELEGALHARADREEAATRRDAELARAGGGAGADTADAEAWDDGDGRPSLTLLEHLEELRVRLVKSVLAILVGGLAGWFFSGQALEFAIRRTVGQVVVLDPIEAFSERFKLALVIGACVALPVVLYQAWAFVLPGLFRRERRLLLPMVGASLVLFFAGAATAILLVVPIVLEVLRTFLTPSMQQNIRLSSLLGFIYNLALATGVVFQLPLVAGALAALGIVTSGALLRQWRLAIVATLVVSALITPGDVVTAQIVLGLPLVVLYLLSVLVAWGIERTRMRRERDPDQEAA
jgi:sec-independent protein translocase protein TatC